MKMGELIEIDGSILEGGGQILRLAMSFSSLLKKSIKVNKIRLTRSKAGLRPQHLTGIRMVAEMCDGKLIGAAVESNEISFAPGDLKSGKFEADTQTAGSISLLIQVALPVSLFGPRFTTLRLKGGTNADMAPPIDHTINVFLRILNNFGGHCDCSILKRGYFPRGGGEVELQISPVTTLAPIKLTEFGSVTHIWGRSYVVGKIPIKVAHEMADTALHILKKRIADKVQVDIERVKEFSYSNNSGIMLFAETNTGCILGASALGSRNSPAKEVGSKAAMELLTAINDEYCVDQYTQDQIIILMALASGKSVVKCGPITLHTKTAIYITEKMTNVKFKFHENETKAGFLECDGFGLKNKYK